MLLIMSTGTLHCKQRVKQPHSGVLIFKTAMNKFGRTVRALRLAKQMSQAEVGDVVGVTRAAVHQWEKGRSVPQLHHIQGLARFFGVSITTLVGGDSSEQSVDAALRTLPQDVSDALVASFLATIEAVKKNQK
jgi:transcriptional regulator with XRE-family HTH domain